jgi:hypothetical protein
MAFMSRAILVTGSDSRYFPLMRETILSIRAKPESRQADLGVLDCGLRPDEAAWCRRQGARLVAPGWDVTFGTGLTAEPSFRAMTARPHLRRYFPGYATYLWLDADVWVQAWAALRLFLKAAQLGDIAVVPEMHRSYRNFRAGREDFEAANGGAYAAAFGEEAARRLIRLPLNNAGVFAMAAGSPAWDAWATTLADAARRSTNMIDQIALNAAIHSGAIREVRLPATCNWIAHLATPAWHAERRAFVEPDPPYQTIGILHLTLDTKWARAVDVPTVGGPPMARPLRYPG